MQAVRTAVFFIPLLSLSLPCQEPPPPAPPPPVAPVPVNPPAPRAARPEDVGSVDAILAALYDVISGPAGKKRDWDRFRSLFADDARLIPLSGPGGNFRLRTLTVEDYVRMAGPALETRGFFEREIARKSESFGGLVHAWSTYESRHAAEDEKPFSRGINSIQLATNGVRWWVVTITWESESKERTIPAAYLPR